MGTSLAGGLRQDLQLYVPRHARPPRPVRAGRSVRGWIGTRIARAGILVAELGARLQLAGPRKWAA